MRYKIEKIAKRNNLNYSIVKFDGVSRAMNLAPIVTTKKLF